MKSESPAVRIESAVMQQLRNAFPGFSDSIIIQASILYALIYCCKPNKKRSIKKEEIKERAKKIKSSGKNISYRIYNGILNKLQIYYEGEKETLNHTDVIKCCLAEVLYLLEQSENLLTSSLNNQKSSEKNLTNFLINLHQSTYTRRELTMSENIAYRSGIKSNKVLNWLLKAIDEIVKTYNIKIYCEPFMGTGNVLCHISSPFSEEILNDKSEELVNLLEILKEDPVEFIKKLMSLDVNKKTFHEQRKLLKDINKKYTGKTKSIKIRNRKEKINKAVAYFYTLLLSQYGDCKSYKKGVTENTLCKKANILMQISERLCKTNISNEDVFDFLQNILKREDIAGILIYSDEPYIFTEGNYQAFSNIVNFHEKLRDLLIDLRNKGAIIFISYRATVSDGNKFSNKDVQKKLDDLYMDKNFFIKFLEVENEQIEILLTSEHVSGSVPYDCKIADLIKKYVRA